MRPLSTDASSAATGPVTPASGQFDPFDPAYLMDPYPQLAQLQGSEPVFFAPALGSWIVTRHATVKAVLRDPARFSALIASDPLKPLCPHARAIIAGSELNVPPMLVNNDPPSHTRYRNFFGAPLQRARMEALSPYVHEVVQAHVDRLASGPNPADLVAALTWDVPALVLFKLLGIPAEDVPRAKSYASSRVAMIWGQPSDEEQVRLSTGAVEYYRYADALVREKAAHPVDDYLSDLIRLRDGDDSRATLHEITAMTFNLLFAGHETTSSLAANLFKAVLADRALWGAIGRGEQAVPAVVEEALRFDAPVQAWRRQARVDVELDGVTVPAGGRLLLMFAAANRDPAQFEQPEAFLPGRRNVTQHLSFGNGIHFCLGAPLARIEVAAMVEHLARRLPGLALVPGQHYPYTPNTSFRALRRLMVTW